MTGFERVVNLKYVIVIPYKDEFELRYIQDIYNYYFADHGLPFIKRWEFLTGKFLREHFEIDTDDETEFLGICIPKTVSSTAVIDMLNDANLGGSATLLTNR